MSAILGFTWSSKVRPRVTEDHSYVAMQMKLGLISEKDAMVSHLRSMLTRSVGQEITIQVDYFTVRVARRGLPGPMHGRLLHSRHRTRDRKHGYALPPDQACRKLIALAEKRKTEDNPFDTGRKNRSDRARVVSHGSSLLS